MEKSPGLAQRSNARVEGHRLVGTQIARNLARKYVRTRRTPRRIELQGVCDRIDRLLRERDRKRRQKFANFHRQIERGIRKKFR